MVMNGMLSVFTQQSNPQKEQKQNMKSPWFEGTEVHTDGKHE